MKNPTNHEPQPLLRHDKVRIWSIKHQQAVTGTVIKMEGDNILINTHGTLLSIPASTWESPTHRITEVYVSGCYRARFSSIPSC